MARSDTRGGNPGIVPHPAYSQFAEVWRRLYDVYEGAGGFLDETRPYLNAHPREWLDHSQKDESGKWVSNPSPVKASPKLKARRKIARYENIAATLIDQLGGALFRKAPQRSFQNPDIKDDHPLRQFWNDADGTGRSIDPVMRDNWTASGVFGHVVLMADRLRDSGPTQADAAPVIVRSYTPLDLVDWLTDDIGNLTAVRLLEASQRTTFSETAGAVVGVVRDVDDTTWTLTKLAKGMKLDLPTQTTGAHGFGCLPVVVLYARRRPLLPTIGRSILGDPQLYIDLYNLTSEVRELLRNQTFALLNVPLGNEGTVEKESALLGETAGTTNVVFSSQPIDYVSPEGTNVQVYHEHIDRLLRTIYRLAVVGWEGDSKDAESADSRKIKHEDLYQMLCGYAAECEQTERKLAEFVYRASYGESWEAQWEKDQPVIAYSDDFDVTSLLDEIETVTNALALELGETATKQIKKRIVPRLLPNLPQQVLTDIESEIDAMEVKTQDQKDAEAMAIRFGGADPAAVQAGAVPAVPKQEPVA